MAVSIKVKELVNGLLDLLVKVDTCFIDEGKKLFRVSDGHYDGAATWMQGPEGIYKLICKGQYGFYRTYDTRLKSAE